MTSKQFSDAITTLGITMLGAGVLLGFNVKSVRRWARGKQPVPRVVAVALAVMIESGITPAQASKLAGYTNRQDEFIDGRTLQG